MTVIKYSGGGGEKKELSMGWLKKEEKIEGEVSLK